MSSQFYKLPVELAARRDLTAASKILWAMLADRIGDNGFCWPGVRKIAGDVGQDVSAVLRGIQKLESAGLLQVERQRSGRANHYRLTNKSAGETQALAKRERSQSANSGAGETHTEALAKRQHNQTDPLSQTKSKGAHTRFIPPSALEVEQYARSIDFPLDAEKFVSHYAANGWMRGKTKMRDWRAAVRYWKTTENTKNEYGSGKIRDHAEPVGEFIR